MGAQLLHESNKYDVIHGGFDRIVHVNDAIAEAIFSEEAAGLPVYLDLDERSTSVLAERLGVPPSDVIQEIINSVTEVIRNAPSKDRIFERFVRADEIWRRGDLSDVPPSLALLATFSLAAERMQHSEEMGANNYYGRLHELLGLGSHDSISSSYQAACDRLWESLALWLETWEGERGLPTVAKTKAQPFVNKAISQALLRDVDRGALLRIFATARLEPQQDMDPEDMESFLAEGLPTYGTANLKKLWRKPDLHEVISQAAIKELRTWTGLTSLDAQGTVNVRLVAVVQRVFDRRLELNLDVLHPEHRTPRKLNLVTAVGATEQLEFTPSGNRSLRLAEAGVIDPGSLIGGSIALRDPDSSLNARREPRLVVPLRHDGSTQIFIEAERIVLGVPHVILARAEVSSSKMGTFHIADEVGQILDTCARPGWARVDSLPGLPSGWVLFQDIELLGVPQIRNRNVALRVLEPHSTSTLVLSGGIQIPGADRKWSSLQPPSITVLNDTTEDRGIVRVLEESSSTPIQMFNVDGAAHVIDLEPIGLGDGNYRIELELGEVSRTSHIRLRSSRTPASRPVTKLSYFPGSDPLGLISAAEHSEGSLGRISGASVDYLTQTLDSLRCTLPGDPWWADAALSAAVKRDAMRARATQLLTVKPPDSGSCVVTGAHYWDLECAWTPLGMRESSDGICRFCGITKTYPTRPRSALAKKSKAGPSTAKLSPTLDLSRIRSVPSREDNDWDVILDALCHLGSGSATDIDRLATQIEGTSLAADRLARGLEALGHLDVALGSLTMRPDRWSCPRAAISICNQHRAIVVGRRSEQLIANLETVVQQNGATIQRISNKDLPTSIRIDSAAQIETSWFADVIDPLTKSPVLVIDRPDRQIAALLAPISTTRTSLPRVLLPAYRTVERWSSAETTWLPCPDASSSGAYRLTGYGVVYGLRDETDIAEGTIRLCTVQLLKHIVAQAESRTLLAYREPEQKLVTRLGADLPGLYGRAAVLCSGLAPYEDTTQRALVYHDVPPDVAALIERAVTT